MQTTRRSSRLPLAVKVLIALVVVLAVVRIAAPYVIKDRINAAINEQADFSGSVADVDLMLWRGGMAVDGVEIFKNSVSTKDAFFKAHRAEAFILWRSLFKGGIVTRALVVRPQIELVATSDADVKRDAAELKKDAIQVQKEVEDPQSPIGELLRTVHIRVDRFVIQDGYMRFRKMDANPPVDLHMDEIELTASNLTNSLRLSDSLVARIAMRAKAQNSGDFTLAMAVNPSADPIDFDLQSKLLNLEAKATNSFTKEYGKFDFERGSIDVVTEVTVRDGHMKGYVKPLLRDIEIHAREDATRDGDGILRRMWEALVGASETVVENFKETQSGSRIPLEGDIKSPGTDLFAAVVEVLRNAYVRALTPQFDGAEVAH